jgi:uncharacterized peroxidase-related enzyme
MTEFTLHDLDSVPEHASEALGKIAKKFGAIPNVYAHMAESPLPLEIYGMAQDLVMSRSTLGPQKVNLVQLAISVEHGCEFCVPAHSWAADKALKTDPEIVAAIREGREGPDVHVNALVSLARSLVRHRGHVPEAEIESFLASGGTREQVFELISIIAFKTITNYTAALAGTRPNDWMAPYAWSAEEAVPA